jgi:hypothetical protein
MGELLDAVERQLSPDAPAEDREALQALRSGLQRRQVTQPRKPFERKVDRVIEARPYLFAAAHRHIGKILPQAVEEAAASLKRARDLLDRAPNNSIQRTRASRSALALLAAQRRLARVAGAGR